MFIGNNKNRGAEFLRYEEHISLRSLFLIDQLNDEFGDEFDDIKFADYSSDEEELDSLDADELSSDDA
ncbi:uncharacterized protein ATC70_001745 [Mucor velutinosus]|uniref:Uncharacterized protein n=1 Tax=Mucor velutinosus TaxID=708070 RepID=A0AAN7DB90_9FUNG|nr:hypothetical protein ATC70_001745 [Mucor velutinosus]